MKKRKTLFGAPEGVYTDKNGHFWLLTPGLFHYVTNKGVILFDGENAWKHERHGPFRATKQSFVVGSDGKSVCPDIPVSELAVFVSCGTLEVLPFGDRSVVRCLESGLIIGWLYTE